MKNLILLVSLFLALVFFQGCDTGNAGTEKVGSALEKLINEAINSELKIEITGHKTSMSIYPRAIKEGKNSVKVVNDFLEVEEQYPDVMTTTYLPLSQLVVIKKQSDKLYIAFGLGR